MKNKKLTYLIIGIVILLGALSFYFESEGRVALAIITIVLVAGIGIFILFNRQK